MTVLEGHNVAFTLDKSMIFKIYEHISPKKGKKNTAIMTKKNQFILT